MPAFTGQLNVNEIQSMIYNMIISQQVFTDNISGVNDALVSRARVDGSLFGDTKLYYSIDALGAYKWLNDAEAANLLQLHRPKAPEVQKIELDQFWQIALTIDNYLSKRAFMDERGFSDWTSAQMQMMSDTKRIHESSLYNCYIGTHKGAATKSSQTVTLPTVSAQTTAVEEEAINRLRGTKIAQFVANLSVELTALSRDYNDYGFIRSYSKERINIVWSSSYLNEINYVDLPSLFHNTGLFNEVKQDVLPAWYFGTVGTQALASATGVERTLVEADFTVGATKYHKFPGEVIPTGASAAANTYYTPDSKIIAKVLIVLPPMMSAFSVGTSFWNPRSLTETHYLTFGYNTLEYLKNYPFIEIKEATPASLVAKRK